MDGHEGCKEEGKQRIAGWWKDDLEMK